MSWDIYGNVLRRGYCEVHPQVHEEYPCSLCYAEDRQRDQRRNEMQHPQPEMELDSYRITATLNGEDGEHLVIVRYGFHETDRKDILEISVYGCYPALLKKITNVEEQVQKAIVSIEGEKNVCFLNNGVSII